MKNRLLYGFCLAIAVCLFSCDKIDQLLTFTISNKSSVTIPATGQIGLPFGLAPQDVTTNSSEAFSNNNTNANDVKNIYLRSLGLDIASPNGQNFNFLKSIHIYISTDNSNEIELAYLDSIPLNVDTLTLTPTSSRLDQYVKASSYSLRTEAVIRQGLSQDVTININSKFQVTANL